MRLLRPASWTNEKWHMTPALSLIIHFMKGWLCSAVMESTFFSLYISQELGHSCNILEAWTHPKPPKEQMSGLESKLWTTASACDQNSTVFGLSLWSVSFCSHPGRFPLPLCTWEPGKFCDKMVGKGKFIFSPLSLQTADLGHSLIFSSKNGNLGKLPWQESLASLFPSSPSVDGAGNSNGIELQESEECHWLRVSQNLLVCVGMAEDPAWKNPPYLIRVEHVLCVQHHPGLSL